MPIQDHEENAFFTTDHSQKYLKATTFNAYTCIKIGMLIVTLFTEKL